MLTGLQPGGSGGDSGGSGGHGIVANGWYFRDLNEIWLWRQSNRLVQGDKLWDVARNRDPSFTCANTFWWYAMATRAEVTLTPRPLYCADGLKLPDFYSNPLELRHEFSERFGTFPLFDFWGPATSIRSSDWIARAAMSVEEKFSPTLQLVYLPHLDYVLQRDGPQADLSKDLREIDQVVGKLIDFFGERGGPKRALDQRFEQDRLGVLRVGSPRVFIHQLGE